jgi:hypothetical protein
MSTQYALSVYRRVFLPMPLLIALAMPSMAQQTYVITDCHDLNAHIETGANGRVCACNAGFANNNGTCEPASSPGAAGSSPGNPNPTPPHGPGNGIGGPDPAPNDPCKTAADQQARQCGRDTAASYATCMANGRDYMQSVCTANISYSEADISWSDYLTWSNPLAPDHICTANESRDQCYRDIAMAKTARDRSNCLQEMVNGSGSWWDKLGFSFGLHAPGLNAGMSVDTSSEKVVGVQQYCRIDGQRLLNNCTQQQQCDRAKCDGRTLPGCSNNVAAH